ncbi:MAG TPA: META domain-containing protein [Gemmatimonadaceae bacterium]|nr:META domain-containing protein [Gemmatimonadaceae bacterium]
MSMMSLRKITVCTIALATLACARRANEGSGGTEAAVTPESDTLAAPTRSIFDREWSLAMLGDSPAPTGSEGKAATMELDSVAARASGFGGCNRYTAPFTIAGDSLHFGIAASTKMACATGEEVERALFEILPKVTGFEATDSTLTLTGASGALAAFRAP